MIIDLKTAHNLLAAHHVVAIPTETVYGLAANATCDAAVAKIYACKQRPSFNPLIIHVASIDAITWAQMNPFVHNLMEEFWLKRQASISFVLPLKTNHPLSLLALAGLQTVAVRRPNHPLALDLLNSLPFPLAAPSANKANKLSPTSAELVMNSLGHDIPVLDGDLCTIGLESTVVSVANQDIQILRAGAVTAEDLTTFGKVTYGNHHQAINAPGMLKTHYAPEHPLYINVIQKHPHMLLIGFGNIKGDYNLSPSSNLQEAASNLFRYLHMADTATKGCIGVAPIPNMGLGIAINDRLSRASQKG